MVSVKQERLTEAISIFEDALQILSDYTEKNISKSLTQQITEHLQKAQTILV